MSVAADFPASGMTLPSPHRRAASEAAALGPVQGLRPGPAASLLLAEPPEMTPQTRERAAAMLRDGQPVAEVTAALAETGVTFHQVYLLRVELDTV